MKKLIIGLCVLTTPAVAMDITSDFGAKFYQQSILGCKAIAVKEGFADIVISVDDVCQCIAYNTVTSVKESDAIALEKGVADDATAKKVSKLSTDVTEKCMKQFIKPELIKDK